MPTSSHAAWRQQDSFTSVKDAVNHGAGHVGKSTVVNTMTRSQGVGYLRQKTTTILRVADKKRDLSKKTIVLVVTLVIVGIDGKV